MGLSWLWLGKKEQIKEESIEVRGTVPDLQGPGIGNLALSLQQNTFGASLRGEDS